MDFRIYARSKMAADSYNSTVERAPGMDFSQILSHSVAGQGRQGESDKYKDRAFDVLREKYKDRSYEAYRPVGIKDLPPEDAQLFHQVRMQYGIPVAPVELVFDTEGDLLLPADYPFAPQMKAALDAHPELKQRMLERSAQTIHFDEVKDALSFEDMDNDELARARFEEMVLMTKARQSN
ncbi:hypothetical protein [Oceanospirillum beijerinckii]|uniref:hypothetical protein n=1 Tax=Oceanospirillum beijerinckii TaxID=64976 RepID=UPI0004133BC4|nr:hypothetical protein [Oceanospirillum beijerinckii]